MYWNYRLVKVRLNGFFKIGIYEVYYDQNDKPFSRTTNPISIDAFLEDKSQQETVDCLREEFNQILKAFNKPVLNDEVVFNIT